MIMLTADRLKYLPVYRRTPPTFEEGFQRLVGLLVCDSLTLISISAFLNATFSRFLERVRSNLYMCKRCSQHLCPLERVRSNLYMTGCKSVFEIVSTLVSLTVHKVFAKSDQDLYNSFHE